MLLLPHMLQYCNLALYPTLATDFGFIYDLYGANSRRLTVDAFMDNTGDAKPKRLLV